TKIVNFALETVGSKKVLVMESVKIRILYVDDEVNNLQAFKATFRRDYKIFLAESAKEAREILKTEEIEIIITDQRMPEETGVEFLESIIPLYPDPIRILLTGYTDIQAVIDSINKGKVYHYLTKPWEEDYLRTVIKNAFDVYSLRKENVQLTNNLRQVNIRLELLTIRNIVPYYLAANISCNSFWDIMNFSPKCAFVRLPL